MDQSLVSLLLLTAGLALSQSYTAALRGVITDSSGAAIPSAQVSPPKRIAMSSTTAVTDEAGRYYLVRASTRKIHADR